MVCFASKTDIPYIQAKMKVKKLTFFMTYQVVLDLGGSPKLILVLYLSCILCYGPKTMGYYPQNIWKMTIFWKLYTGQWQTACLLVKVVPFLIVITKNTIKEDPYYDLVAWIYFDFWAAGWLVEIKKLYHRFVMLIYVTWPSISTMVKKDQPW